MRMAAVSRSGRALAAVLPVPNVGRRLRALSLTRLLPSGTALVIGFSLLGAGAVAYIGARETSMFAVRAIEISGAPPRVAAHVRAALRPLEGQSLLAVGRGRIDGRLAGLSDVAHVSFDRDFPHTLRIVVIPAHSVAVLRRGPAAWIVSSDGRVVRAAGIFSAPRLPRVWVPRATGVDVGSTLADTDAARAVWAVAVARSEGFAARVQALRSSPQELTFVLVSGLEIRFGDSNALAVKVAVARRILPLLGEASTYLDVSVPARPVADGDTQVSS
jgi:cell division protein FtsQ